MKADDFKKLLERPELNKSGIAAKMYPDIKLARNRLNSKTNGLKYGNGAARLTDEDLAKGWEVLKDLADDILSKGPEKQD